MTKDHKPFWSSVPGILTGVAAIITAVTGAIVALGPPEAGNESETSSPPATADSAVSQPPVVDYSRRTGYYIGSAFNADVQARGDMFLLLNFIERPNGQVRGSVRWTGDLRGQADLAGFVDEEGALILTGNVSQQTANGETYVWRGDLRGRFVSESAIEGTYEVAAEVGNPYGTQEGSFSVEKED